MIKWEITLENKETITMTLKGMEFYFNDKNPFVVNPKIANVIFKQDNGKNLDAILEGKCDGIFDETDNELIWIEEI